MTVKQRLHEVVDAMSDEEAEATLRAIDVRRTDPIVRHLDALPEDDEPLCEDDRVALDVAYDDLRAGRRIPFEDIRDDLR